MLRTWDPSDHYSKEYIRKKIPKEEEIIDSTIEVSLKYIKTLDYQDVKSFNCVEAASCSISLNMTDDRFGINMSIITIKVCTDKFIIILILLISAPDLEVAIYLG